MKLRVFKFGGALLKDAAGVRRVVGFLEEYACEPLVVVVSAIGKTTNALEKLIELKESNDKQTLQQKYFELKTKHLQLATDLFPEGKPDLINALDEYFRQLWETLENLPKNRFQAYDSVVSFGERMAGLIVQHTAQEASLPLQYLPATALIATDSNHTNAHINWEKSAVANEKEIMPLLKSGQIVLTQGFIGSDDHGHITTLGREGSDFTAAILAYLLHADEVTIWKDVPGLMNADPQRFPDCIKFDKLSYHEAIELAFYGATIIHPKTIQPLKKRNIPLYVRSFFHPETTPTCISSETTSDEKLHSIIVKDNQVLFSANTKDLSFIAEEHLTDLFAAFSQCKIHLNLMQHSAVSFSVCFDYQANKLEQLLGELENNLEVKYNLGLQLITLRNYTPELIQQITKSRQIFLEQRSRSTFQVLVKNE